MNTIFTKELIANIDTEKFKALFKTKPHLFLLATVYNWLIIIVIPLYFSSSYAIWWLYPLGVFIIGARIHALAILVHDAAHFRFLKNRKWSDIVTNCLISYHIYLPVEKYRHTHLEHHQHLNTDEDPDWVLKMDFEDYEFPKTKVAFLQTVLSYLFLYKGISVALIVMKRFSKVKTSG